MEQKVSLHHGTQAQKKNQIFQVCGIVGRADLLCALFFIISFMCYTNSTKPGCTSVLWLILSLAAAATSMFCKEQGITVMGVCLVYDAIIVNRVNTVQLLQAVQHKMLDRGKPESCHATSTANTGWTRTLVRRSTILLVFTSALTWFRYYLMNYQGPQFTVVDNPASFQDNSIIKVLSYNYIFFLNLWLLLCPEWLCFDWSMGCIPLLTSTDRRIIFVLLFWIFLFVLVSKGLLDIRDKTRRDILLPLSLLVIPFLPASNLLFRVGFVVAERVLYIPSLGFCLLVVLGFQRLINKYPNYKNDLTFVLCLLLMLFLIRSNERSKEWQTEVLLFNSALSVCPLNAKVHYNVGKSSADIGLENKAITHYREAIRLYPDYDQAMNNLANILKSRGELTEAEILLRRALRLRNDFPAAWMNLGIVMAHKKRYQESEKCYLNAIRFRRACADCYYNLGNLFLETDRPKDAERAWISATKLKPTSTVAWNNLILLYDNNGNHTRAVEVGTQALHYNPTEPSIFFNLANALGKLGRFQESEALFLQALKLAPDNGLYNVNLGVLYHRWKKYEKAVVFYKRALQINPGLESAIENYSMLRKHMKRIGMIPDN